MKRYYSFLFFLLVVLVPADAFALNKVILRGQLNVGKTRSEAEPIESYSSTSDGVYAAFNEDLGYVLIEVVTADDEVVYQTIVDSGEEDAFIAPEDMNLQSGSYTIRFTCVYGEQSGVIAE